jgi:hypothetical protein
VHAHWLPSLDSGSNRPRFNRACQDERLIFDAGALQRELLFHRQQNRFGGNAAIWRKLCFVRFCLQHETVGFVN